MKVKTYLVDWGRLIAPKRLAVIYGILDILHIGKQKTHIQHNMGCFCVLEFPLKLILYL
jgi:hypothetical protein